MAAADEAQYQGSASMASAQSPSYFLSPMISPTGSTSPHSPTPLPVSSPELLSESEHPPPIHTSSGRSTPPTLFPASSETPLPSPTYSPARSTHLSIVDTRPDLASPSGSRSRSSSLRYAFPPPRTPPRTPLVEQANTSRTTTTPSAASPSTKRHNNGHVPGSLSRTRSPGSGPLANIRRNSQDRRVRSEGLAPRASPMARRKSASLVTGGYVTSESDSLSDKDDGGDASARPSSSHVTTSFFSSRPTQLVVQERRKRAQSLMSPIPVSDHSPSGDGSGSTRSFGSGRSDKRKPQDIAAVDYAHPDRERSQSVSNSRPPALPRSSLLRANGHSNPRSPLSSNPPSRLPSARVAPAEASSSRHPSYRSAKNGHERVSSSRSPPRNLEELPARSREVDRVRHEEGVSSSEGSRKGKERARDSSTKRNALAASLAHSSRSRDSAVLTDEQIQNLFSHSEIGKVARLNQGPSGSSFTPVKPDRRSSVTADARPPEPPHRELYTVTAPPALIRDEDGQLRDRTFSVSSSVAPSPRRTSQRIRQASMDEDEQETEPAQRRRESRRRSSTVVEPEGGHVPFTHHLPSRLNEVHEGSSGEDASAATTFDDDRPSTSTSHAPPQSDSPSKASDKKRKGRLSGFFRRSPKSSDNLRKNVSPHHLPSLHHDQVKVDHAKAHEQYEKDKAIRQLEQERRDAELAEERKYQAFLEVQAHPAAATRASQVASHLWARYSQVYETIEEPPKLNPLAILRFKHKTAEQDEARARYKEERAELDKEPTSFPSVWTQGGPPSSASLGGRTKPRSTGVSTKDARSSTSIKSGKTNYVTAPGWQYTVDDASAYRAAGGRVQYHMPQQAIDTAIIRSVDSLPVTQANRSHAGGDDFNPSSDAHAIDLGSSLGSQGRRSIGLDGDHQPVFNGNLRSTSMLSVNGATSNSPGSSRMDLARTSSIEAGHANRSPSTRRHVRRTRQNPSHQSMSVLPQSLAHPIDSWKSWTDGRRQHTMPHSGSATPLGADSGVDEPIKTKRSIHHIDTPSRIMPPRSTPLAPTRPRAAMRFHATPLREQETAPVSDEEQRHRSFRQFAESAKAKLFVGQNKVPTTPGGSPSKHSARDPIKETERLTAVREAEMHFEERIGGDHGPTERRKRAEAQLESYEQRIYRDRQTSVMSARERMAGFTPTATYAEDFMRLQLAHIEQLKNIATVSAEVDVDFPGVESIRERYINSRRRSTHGDLAWDSRPPSRRASRRASIYGPSLLPPTYPMATKPWPRRAALDRHGDRIDPLSQVELVLRDAEQVEEGMRRSKAVARTRLQDMSQAIATLHDTKNRVRDELEVRVEELKRMRDHLTNTERLLCARASWWGFESSRETDKWVDMFFRHPVSASLRLLNLILELPFLPLKSWRNFGWTIGLLAVGTAFIMALP